MLAELGPQIEPVGCTNAVDSSMSMLRGQGASQSNTQIENKATLSQLCAFIRSMMKAVIELRQTSI